MPEYTFLLQTAFQAERRLQEQEKGEVKEHVAPQPQSTTLSSSWLSKRNPLKNTFLKGGKASTTIAADGNPTAKKNARSFSSTGVGGQQEEQEVAGRVVKTEDCLSPAVREGYRRLVKATLSLGARADAEVQAALTLVHKTIGQLDAPYTGWRVVVTPRPLSTSKSASWRRTKGNETEEETEKTSPSAASPWMYLVSSNEEEEEEDLEKPLMRCDKALKAIGESVQASLQQVLEQTMSKLDTKKKDPPHRPPSASHHTNNEDIHTASPLTKEEENENRREPSTLWEVKRGNGIDEVDAFSHSTSSPTPTKSVADVLLHVERILEEVRHTIAAARIELMVCTEEVRAVRRQHDVYVHQGGIPSLVNGAFWGRAEELIQLGRSKAVLQEQKKEKETNKKGPHADTGEKKREKGGASHATASLAAARVKGEAMDHNKATPRNERREASGKGTRSPPPTMRLGLMTGSKHLLDSVVESVTQSVKEVDEQWTRKLVHAMRGGSSQEGAEGKAEEEEEVSKSRRTPLPLSKTILATPAGWRSFEEMPEEQVPAFFSPLPSSAPLQYTEEETLQLMQEHARLEARQCQVLAEDANQVEAAVRDLSQLNSLVSEAVSSQRETFNIVLKNTEEAQVNMQKATLELEKPLGKFWNARRQLIALLWCCILVLWISDWLFR